MPQTATSSPAISELTAHPPVAQDARDIAPAAVDFNVTVHDTLSAVEPIWRRFEREAVTSVYQSYDWLRALIEARGTKGSRVAIAVIADADGPVAILPLAIRNKLGVAIGELLGSDISNVDWMPVLPAALPRLTRAVLDQMLREVARKAGGLDALSLHALPEKWLGHDNPFLSYPHQPGPDHLFIAPIGAGTEPRANQKRVRNILRGKRRLEELMGAVELRAARTPAEVDEIHKVFLEQRAARFAEQGIANIFAEDWFVRFFREAAVASLGSERPTLQFHALYAGDEIVATSCGAYCGSHFSQYINSATMGPAAKSSLMGLLMLSLTEELIGAGITSMDMGLGDFDYKKGWTDPATVYDTIIPLTPAGWAFGNLLLAARRLKRTIKQTPALWKAATTVRRIIGGRAAAPVPTTEKPDE